MKSITIRRATAALLSVCLLIGLTACGSGAPVSSAPPTTTTAPTTTTTTAPPTWMNPLTGVQDLTTQNNRPIGFVVTDEDSKHIQLNIEHADMYFEAETEGGIPRMLAIFSSVDRIPDAIGPVRSARPHFVKMAKSLDMIYCHVGGSKTGLNTIKELGVQDLGNEFEVNAILKNSANLSWNRDAFTKAKVLPAIQKKKYKTTTTRNSPFEFGDKAGTSPATTLVVRISDSYDMAFTYDAASGLYQKHRNALNTPIHTSYTGGTVTAKNVIVMYDRRFVDETYNNKQGGTTTRYNFDMNGGEGLLVSGGTSRPIRWKRTNNQLTYYEADGATKLTVAQGKTYICLASTHLKDRTKVY
ncbi:MAG: DUF3048 domain-containing protein [Clostridia bacterium]|nr:DUF3048 domain-containing protein [Clostridia bacterium]